MVLGVIILLVFGIVSVFATGSQNKLWGHHKNFEGKGAWLEKIGLSEDATDEEIIAIKKEMWADNKNYSWFGDKEDYAIKIREKLGLSEDATDEEVKIAIQEFKDENNFYSKQNYHGSKFSKGFGCGKV